MAQEVETRKQPVRRVKFPPERYEQAKEALKRLAEIGRSMPPCDAVALVREGRELLEERNADDGR